MNNYLNNLLKKISGKLIAIGLNDKKLINTINDNDKIIECNLLNSISLDDSDTGKIKKIRLGKLKKKFKKNKPNYVIYNIDSIDSYREKFVYDTLYLANDEIYIYSESNYNIDSIIRRYKRFSNVEIINTKDGNIYKIVRIKKINKLNELFYKTKDNIIDAIDIISNLLS